MSIPTLVSRASQFLIVWLGTVALGGCSAPPSPAEKDSLGARMAFGQSELYYTPGVTADEARALGELLTREQGFGDHPATVQVRYENRVYEVRFVVHAGIETTCSARPWRVLAVKLSRECFRTSPVDIHLTDEKLQTLRIIPYEPLRPELPVTVTFRSSIDGGSLVAQYRNRSNRHLVLPVVLQNPTLHQTATTTLTLRPNQITEHGWLEGWSYVSGETITMTHADYETMELRVP